MYQSLFCLQRKLPLETLESVISHLLIFGFWTTYKPGEPSTLTWQAGLYDALSPACRLYCRTKAGYEDINVDFISKRYSFTVLDPCNADS